MDRTRLGPSGRVDAAVVVGSKSPLPRSAALYADTFRLGALRFGCMGGVSKGESTGAEETREKEVGFNWGFLVDAVRIDTLLAAAACCVVVGNTSGGEPNRYEWLCELPNTRGIFF